jgi:fatty acid-binding protein 7
MKALGVGLVSRKMASSTTPVIEITVENGECTIKTNTSIRSSEIKFRLGEEFDETTFDGRKSKSLITIDGDKMLHIQRSDGKEYKITREINGNELKAVLYAKDVVCTRLYERV